jgi:hypothetical protein
MVLQAIFPKLRQIISKIDAAHLLPKLGAPRANHLREFITHEGNPLTPLRAAIYNHRADSGSDHLPIPWLRNLIVRGEVPT